MFCYGGTHCKNIKAINKPNSTYNVVKPVENTCGTCPIQISIRSEIVVERANLNLHCIVFLSPGAKPLL